MSKRCTECKLEFDDTKLFCPNCGAELQKIEAGTTEVKSENVDINNSEYEEYGEYKYPKGERFNIADKYMLETDMSFADKYKPFTIVYPVIIIFVIFSLLIHKENVSVTGYILMGLFVFFGVWVVMFGVRDCLVKNYMNKYKYYLPANIKDITKLMNLISPKIQNRFSVISGFEGIKGGNVRYRVILDNDKRFFTISTVVERGFIHSVFYSDYKRIIQDIPQIVYAIQSELLKYEDKPEGAFKDSESLYNYNLTKRTALIGVVTVVLIAVVAFLISFIDKTDNNSEDSQYYYDETVDNINNTVNNNNSQTNENNTAENRLSEQDYIYAVRYGKYSGYPNITFNEAFSHYFGDPEWNYMKAEDGSDVVEFTGRCMYDGTEVTALIQFVVNMDDGSFEWKYLSFNDVSQTQFMLGALIDNAFKSVVMDSDDYKAALSNFVGTWDDKYSGRCHMDITQRDDGDFDIEIRWGNSAFSTTVWKMTGKFVSPTELTYADCECTDEGENGINEYYYTLGTGTIDIADDGYLYWHDYEEGAGDECFFEKSEYAQ